MRAISRLCHAASIAAHSSGRMLHDHRPPRNDGLTGCHLLRLRRFALDPRHQWMAAGVQQVDRAGNGAWHSLGSHFRHIFRPVVPFILTKQADHSRV